MKILAFTYGHPEAHGALISSILSISENANNVDFYYKNNYKITFKFPDNVTFIPNSFKIIPEDKFFKSSKFYKFFHFVNFTFKLIFNKFWITKVIQKYRNERNQVINSMSYKKTMLQFDLLNI